MVDIVWCVCIICLAFILSLIYNLIYTTMKDINEVSNDRCILIFLLSLLIVTPIMMYDFVPTTYTENDIVLLKDNVSVDGHFFLGTGYVGSNMKYFFYCIDEDGYYLRSVGTYNTRIIEDDDVVPFIKEKHGTWRDKSEIKYWIYVPEGTIIQQFVLNGE